MDEAMSRHACALARVDGVRRDPDIMYYSGSILLGYNLELSACHIYGRHAPVSTL